MLNARARGNGPATNIRTEMRTCCSGGTASRPYGFSLTFPIESAFMSLPHFGMLGLGTMGSNLALNVADHGFRLAGYNREPQIEGSFRRAAGDLMERIDLHFDLQEFVDGLAKPRAIFMMVTAGKVVDIVLDQLVPMLDEGDLVIDGGNSDYKDTMRRTEMMEAKGLGFLGVGVSGGEVGARYGPSMMIGGSEKLYDQVDEILKTIAADFEGNPCADWLGPDGAGHFVKTVHNGIEYGDMQMIAEAYGIMSEGLGMSADEIGAVFKRWNEGDLKSYLIEITADLLAHDDPDTGKAMVDVILDKAGQKGTGRWSVIEAQTMGIPATVMEAAVTARALSARKQLRTRAEEIFGAPGCNIDRPRNEVIADLEQSLIFGKVIAYTQGFNVLAAASAEHDWNLDMARIAEVWRAGCIIRSSFLDEIADAFRSQDDLGNLLFAEGLAKRVTDAEPAMRRINCMATADAMPIIALSSALQYFDYFRRGRSTANIIQAQRDYFGAHGFERTDREGEDFHGPWALGTLGQDTNAKLLQKKAEPLDIA